MRAAAAVGAAVLLLAGCGYRVSGRGAALPAHVKTLAAPAFRNGTTRYRLPGLLARDLTREFNTRTRYRVVEDASQADAVLEGTILTYNANPTIFDPATGRASAVQATVTMQVTLKERASGAVLFTRPYMEVRNRYQISVDPAAYLDESDVAMERLSLDAARSIAAAILENF